MVRFVRLSLVVLFTFPMFASATPPQAPEKSHEINELGHVRNDPYFWLREKDNPETIKYLEAENRYAKGILKQTEKLQETLYKEIRGRIKEEDQSVPEKVDDYFYYTRTETGKQYPIHCRKKGSLDAKEEVILNENDLAKGQKYFRVGVFAVSPDHSLLAYSIDTNGSEHYVLQIKNLQTDALLSEKIDNTYYTFAWANDNKTFFYDQLDSADRPFKARKHLIGSDVTQDPTIYEEKDDRFFLEISKSHDDQFIFIKVESKLSTEIRYLEANKPNDIFSIIQPREENVLYSIDHHDDRFFIVTNKDAKNFKLVETPVAAPGNDHWKDFIPYNPEVTINEISAFKNYLVISQRKNGLPAIQVYDLNSGETHNIEFDEPDYDVEMSANPEFKTNTVRITYNSFVTPNSVIDYDMSSRQKEVKKVTPVLGGYQRDDYVTERIFAKADDGANIPISLFYKKGFIKNGTAPLWLDGYGAYGVDNDVYFNPAPISLVDRGFVYAIAHIRGGGELGRTWYEDGKLLKKKNTFTDFIRATEHLIDQKYVGSKKITISGGSAGGLLMGAVMNMRPDLFTTVIAAVPFVDVLNTMSDPTLPLTVTEYEEWGNPKDSAFYDYMASYSPYDNVSDAPHPNLFASAGFNDPRVSYWEPAKWVAKQRKLKDQKRILILRTNMGAGHGGDSGRFDQIKQIAREYAFAIDTLGVSKRIDSAKRSTQSQKQNSK
jgi:oligopeptidase B